MYDVFGISEFLNLSKLLMNILSNRPFVRHFNLLVFTWWKIHFPLLSAKLSSPSIENEAMNNLYVLLVEWRKWAALFGLDR